MQNKLSLFAAVAVVSLVVGSSCNCGKPVVMTTTGSVTLAGDTLDFGVVPEGTSKGGKFRIDNDGRAPVTIAITLKDGTSADFKLGTTPTTVEAGSFAEVPVVFSPVASGEDTGTALVSLPGTNEMPLEVHLHGGPIVAQLVVDPDPVDFRPATMALTHKSVQLKSVGTAALNIRTIAISQTGNPDFALTPPMLPAKLLPGEFITVGVDYSRSTRSTAGVMQIESDDVDAGMRDVQLLPDAIGAQCVDGAMQACTGANSCNGTRMCAGGQFGACMCGDSGVVMMDAGVDAGVDAGFDAGTGSCNANGLFTIDAGSNPINYQCCDYLGLGIISVDLDVKTLTIQNSASSMRPLPRQPGGNLPVAGTAAMCPAGSFIYTRTLPGGCNETYTVSGTFLDPNTFVGTYTAQFSGSDCAGAMCGGLDCADQSWTFEAKR
ncbi:MAG: choice-of-anchor D domain-containing protein [Myxococcaceae bacterium]